MEKTLCPLTSCSELWTTDVTNWKRGISTLENCRTTVYDNMTRRTTWIIMHLLCLIHQRLWDREILCSTGSEWTHVSIFSDVPQELVGLQTNTEKVEESGRKAPLLISQGFSHGRGAREEMEEMKQMMSHEGKWKQTNRGYQVTRWNGDWRSVLRGFCSVCQLVMMWRLQLRGGTVVQWPLNCDFNVD